MTMEIAILGTKICGALLLGLLEGNGAVYLFNHMPPRWFCDYGEDPSPQLLDPYTQRIKSYPWKFLLSMLFMACNLWMVMDNAQFAAAASIALWLLTELSIADIKYRIVPDQLLILLALTGLGFLPFYASWKQALLGALIGFGFMMFIAIIGKMAYKRDAIGGGDIKLFASLGLLCGPAGIISIFLMTSFFSAGHYGMLLAAKKIKRTDTMPMVPYIAVSGAIYFLFLWGKLDAIAF